MTKSVGRPLKYKAILKALAANTIYTPASIAHFAAVQQLLPGSAQKTAVMKTRVRIALGRLSNARAFPDEGDGQVFRPKQRPTPGWFGWRWQSALEEHQK